MKKIKEIKWRDVKKDLDISKEDKVAIKFEEELIDKIIEIRENKGISQTELAKKTNLKQSAIARFEKATHSPQLDTIFNILYSLGYTLKIAKI